MTELLQSALSIAAGIGLLFGGGEFFVQGATSLALILGIPQLVIGLTIVSLGTSAPELFVSLGSLLRQSDTLAISNVVGSNIFNVLVVLGASALVMPLRVESRLIKRDVPLLLAISAAVWGMASSGNITWQAGVALLIALTINTIWEIRTAKEEPKQLKETESQIGFAKKYQGWLKAVLKVFLGIILLAFGTNFLISGAKDLATSFGWSEAIIGLTIVSAGTSLPELITSLVATFRGSTDLAIGNVLGSSLLNQLLVLGSCATFSGSEGIDVEQILIHRDFPIMILTTLACLPIFWTKGKISRQEGGLLLGLYFLYLADQLLPITLPTFQGAFRSTILLLIIPAIAIIILFKSITYWHSIRN